MFAQTLPPAAPQRPFIILSTVDSTNNYAMAKLHASVLPHGTSLLALEQTAGKGQRGKQWLSAYGQNITMSTAFSIPHSFSADIITKIQSYPFLFSAAVALGCYDFIKACGVHDIKIKWPNDLYIGDRKAGGILIENIHRSSQWIWAVAGVGINLNQHHFDTAANKAISLSEITNRQFDVITAAQTLHRCLHQRISWLNTSHPQTVLLEYNQHLYKRNEPVRLKKNNAVFTTTITRVDLEGRLHSTDVIDRNFTVGEVEFVSA